MLNDSLFSSHWRIKPLIALNLIAIMVLLSWLWQPTRVIWDAIDVMLFDNLNHPLASNLFLAKLWAITNMRPVDMGVGLILFGLLIKKNWALPAHQVRRAFMAMFALLVLLLLVRFGFDAILKALHWKRSSPSLALPEAVRLTQMFPDWTAHLYLKDSSEQCFPGDHASVLMVWLMLIWGFLRGAKLALACALTAFFMLPRLAAGAHWASDDLVGGVFLAFVAFGWGYYSPYTAKTSAWLLKLTAPIFRLLAKVPLINRLAIVTG
jgi:membrane-associated phospholipid phosphatase